MSGLVCNNVMCRAPLGDGKVYVTFCSHIFCSGCGEMVADNLTCGACRTNLTGDWRVVQVDQAPVNEWRALVLAGLHPTIILEVATKALAFHYHQVQLEARYIQDRMKRVNQRLEEVKNYYEEVIEHMRHQIDDLEQKIEQKEKMEEKMYMNLGPSTSVGLGNITGLGFNPLGHPMGGRGGNELYPVGRRGGNELVGLSQSRNYGNTGNRAVMRYSEAESLASVLRSVPVARINGRSRPGKLF